MNPELSVKISADIDLLRDNFRKAIGNINKFDKDTKAALTSVDKGFERLANDIDKDMGKVSSNVSAASNSISKSLASAAAASAKSGTAISAGSNKAAMALTDVGRVAQDLPYGFMAIQNNLNPMIESFGRLKAETGSTGGALKAMLNSLSGPAGLGIALSVVSAGILLYQQYARKAKKETDELGSSVSALERAYKSTDYTNIIKDVNEMAIILDMAKRGVVDKESALKKYNDTIGKTAGEVKTLDDAESQLLAKGDAIIKMTLLKAAAQLALEDAAKKSYEAELSRQKKLSDFSSSFESANFGSQGFGGTGAFNEKEFLRNKQRQLDAQQKRKNEEVKIAEDGAKEQLKIVQNFYKQIEKLAKEQDLNILEPLKKPSEKQIKEVRTALVKNLEGIGSEPIKLGKPIEVSTDIKVNILDVQYPLTQWQKKLQEFADSSSEILTTGVGDAFAGLAAGIGESLANGSSFIETVGSNLLDVVGNIAINLGKAAIGIGIAMDAIKNAFKAGPAAVAAGVALIAIGTFIKSQVPKITQGESSGQSVPKPIPQFASGVNNFRGGVALVGERGPELVNLPTGSDVINSNRTNQILNHRNSDNKVQVFGEVGFEMDKFVIKFISAEKRLRRQGLII